MFSQLLEKIIQLDDHSLRILIFLETLKRSEKDFKEFIEVVFGQTWEYLILKAILMYGPMNKSQLSFKLFGTKDKYYTFSRRNAVYNALTRLLKRRILIQKGNLFQIDVNYQNILKILLG
jgi:hypothetical protein